MHSANAAITISLQQDQPNSPQAGAMHLHSLKTNKQPLVRDKIRAPIALAQLVRSVDGPAQNQGNCQSQKRQEQPHSRRQGLRAGIPSIPNHVFCKGDDEDENHNDLQHQAGHGDVDPRIARPLTLRGERTARGLEREAYQVGGDEDPVEEVGVEGRKLRREMSGDSRLGERHVDGGRVEYRTRGDEDDLDEEGDEVERALVQQNTRRVSDNLDEAPGRHKGHEAPDTCALDLNPSHNQPCTPYCYERHCTSVAEGKDRCSECALRGYTSCNPGGTSSDAYNRVLREKDRLDRERASAEEDLERAMARLQRIRRQEKFLRQKAAEMIARGVESLDELEAQERLELESNMLNQTPEFLADLGFPIPDEFLFSGGTVQATSSSS
ncbi:Boty-Like Retrotransposon [Metarhizium acridum CQMa 102]|uniref:Boty-Like Retrotransposon n=1 Tax=Metarhizium acridum (strain CQMa 102) TaxID=655827 RepID=E9DYX0_METAQ|nr:Boty-Like Retrotransposon [Metarhizium acridum CQMa 102]EFY91147.1 Boty-Like Retrotransposon [Metarhizium acridum CQMa 102]